MDAPDTPLVHTVDGIDCEIPRYRADGCVVLEGGTPVADHATRHEAHQHAASLNAAARAVARRHQTTA